MSQQIDAIYDNGVLRPLVPLALPGQARVKVTVATQPESLTVLKPQNEWEQRLLDLAKNCGVSLPNAALCNATLYE
jgi:predicted DNA-binding antitoxin AbrB/MazE fold protein